METRIFCPHYCVQNVLALMLIESVSSHARLSAGPGFRAFFVRTQATLSCDQKINQLQTSGRFKQTTPYKQHGGEWSVV